MFVVCIRFGKTLAVTSLNIFFSSHPSSSLRTPITHILDHLKMFHNSVMLLIFDPSLCCTLDNFYCYVFKLTNLLLCNALFAINPIQCVFSFFLIQLLH